MMGGQTRTLVRRFLGHAGRAGLLTALVATVAWDTASGCGGQHVAAGFATSAPMEASVSGGEVASSSADGSEPFDPPVAPPSPVPTLSTVTTTTVTAVIGTFGATPGQQATVAPEPPPHALLTAASVGDHDRRDNYLDFISRHPGEAHRVDLDMTRRLRIRVTDHFGRPVNAARVDVTVDGRRARGMTHADGAWDFYPGISVRGSSGRGKVRVTVGQRSVQAEVDLPAYADGQPIELRIPGAAAIPPQVLDLGFAIDVTGSMEDELRYVNGEIAAIVRRVQREAPEVRVRVGATFYRDRSDRLVVQQIPFSSDVAGFARAMQGVRASGGGDYPEDMNAGLEASFERLGWSEGNAARVLVLIADAPPKRYADAQYTYHDALRDAAARGIRILPVAASGADREVEYLFRALGAFTSTPYVYLTDDSGIGGRHQEADTDRVAVEYFGDLLTRLVVSDLAGHGMHEAAGFALAAGPQG